jgi:hypothetical protein
MGRERHGARALAALLADWSIVAEIERVLETVKPTSRDQSLCVAARLSASGFSRFRKVRAKLGVIAFLISHFLVRQNSN